MEREYIYIDLHKDFIFIYLFIYVLPEILASPLAQDQLFSEGLGWLPGLCRLWQ